MSGTSLLNSTSIMNSMQRISLNFEKMYARKAYVHWYTNEGMDLSEFDEAFANVRDLISEYEQYQEGQAPEEDDEAEIIYDKQGSQSHGINTTRASSRASHME